ncbi:sensor histidine kinase [Streptomyces sp. NEAU-Y11]|uniref:sensor histidine kinase n=1 Tax=Streptomyces cucumeris TaxID=2962890 RepID=UPI0020C88351|nr:sensor histidine kinase [Streptomyces sp. NEAU-Y11]MCP9207201.1 sensor histidine kinase [Streptomyces sp. NEAU-Y11]
MPATPPPPLLRRVPPGVWTAITWCAGAALSFLLRLRLPGEPQPTVYPGVLLYRWDGLTALSLATALALAGSARLPRRPLGALGLLLAGSVIGSTALSVAEIPLLQFLAVDVAICAIAATWPRRTGLIALAMSLGVLIGYAATRVLCRWPVGTSTELTVALTTVIAWLLGNSAHQAREHAERSRAQAAAQAVTAERLRIARELHDMVAHSIGIIALQAGAARRVIDTQPAGARDALDAIESAGRETLSGLRRMLGALRQAAPVPGQDTDVQGLGLADLDRLAANTTAAGVRVDVRRSGTPRPLPPEVDMSAYRIVQEAVTNVVRHAGADACRVTIDHREDALSVEVVDGGRGPERDTGYGYGLLGMRERVGLLHGEFTAGPRPGGGFRVAARLPVVGVPVAAVSGAVAR